MKAYNGLLKKLLIAVLTAGLLSACGGKEERKAKYLERGKAYLAEKSYDKARIEFKNVLQIDPKDALGYLYLAEVEEKNQNWSRAFGGYKKAVELDPELMEPKIRLATIYLAQAGAATAQKKTDSAANAVALASEYISEIRIKAPDNLDGQVLEAAVWLREGDEKRAQEQLERVVKKDVVHPYAITLLSGIYSQNDKFDDAESLLIRAAENSAEPQSFQLKLAQLYIRHDKKDKAEDTLRQILRENSEELAPAVTLASFLTMTGQADKAEEVLRGAVGKDPDDMQRHILLADFLLTQYGADAAIQELKAVLASGQGSSDLKFKLVAIYIKEGKEDAAVAFLEQIVDEEGLEPAGLQARVMLAKILAAGGSDSERSELLLDEVLAENSRDNEALLIKGKLAARRGDYVEAINNFRSVLKDQPGSLEVLRLLSAAHYANGEVILGKEMLVRAVGAEPDNVEVRVLYARHLVKDKDVEGALEQLDFILEKDPDNLLALQVKYDVLALRGDAAGMETVARKIQSVAPDSAEGYIRESRLKLAQGDSRGALSSIDAFLENSPDNAQALLTKTDILAKEGQFEEALDTIQRYLESEPDSADGYLMLAKIKQELGSPEDARRAYDKVLSLAPESSEALRSLVAFMVQQGELPQAEELLQTILAGDPEHASVNEYLGEVYILQKAYRKAGEAFNRQIGITPGSVAPYLQLAKVRMAQDDVSGAVSSYEQGLQAIPDSAELMIGLAGVYEKQGDFESAIALYESVLEKQPGNAVSTNNLAALLADHRSDETSLAKAREFSTQLEKTNQPAFLDTAAWVYYRTGDYDKAAEILEGVVEKAPKIPVFQYHLGMVYFKQGKKDAARKHLILATDGDFNYQGIEEARATLKSL